MPSGPIIQPIQVGTLFNGSFGASSVDLAVPLLFPPQGEKQGPAGQCRLSSAHIRPEGKSRSKKIENPYLLTSEGNRYNRVVIPGAPRGDDGRKRRGKVKPDFNPSKRGRMLDKVNSVDRRGLEAGRFFLFTLTYPLRFPTAIEAQGHLNSFRRRLMRAYDGSQIWGWWKLEAQKRGAPHYHLLLYMPAGTEVVQLKEWAAAAWVDIACPKDSWRDQMLWVHQGKCGNKGCVEQVRDWNGVASYAAKYIGKLGEFPASAGWEKRLWGEWGTPPRVIVREDLSREVAIKLRRSLWKKLGSELSGRIVVTYQSGTIWRGWSSDLDVRMQSMGCTYGEYLELDGAKVHRLKRRVFKGLGGVRVFADPVQVRKLAAFYQAESQGERVRVPFDYDTRSDESFIGSAIPSPSD